MRRATEEQYHRTIQRFVSAVFQHLDEQITVNGLADYVGYSRFHFGRLFYRFMNESVSEFVIRIRLERAAWSIRNTDDALGRIALDAGYGSPEAFARAFRSRFEILPSQFRDQEEAQVWLETPNGVHWNVDGVWKSSLLVALGNKLMEINVVTKPKTRYIGLAHKGAYNEIGNTFEKLMMMVGTQGIPMNGPSAAFYYDDPNETPAAELRSHAAIPVPADYKYDASVFDEILVPETKFASHVYKGPYTGIEGAWQQVMVHGIPDAGLESNGEFCMEQYLNDPRKEDPENYLTELLISIR